MIKAIETNYAGCRFRSRIEARWAVFFDTLGIRYEYEKEGYTLPPFQDTDAHLGMKDQIAGVLNYLPDFYIPAQRAHPKPAWYEVKGEEREPDWVKLYRLVRHSSIDGALLFEIPNITDAHNMGGTYGMWTTSYFDDRELGKYFGNGGWDCGYSFCECPFCGAIGYEFNGRSARVGCKCPGHESIANGDKTYNSASPRLVEAYRASRRHRFGT